MRKLEDENFCQISWNIANIDLHVYAKICQKSVFLLYLANFQKISFTSDKKLMLVLTSLYCEKSDEATLLKYSECSIKT